MELQQHFYEQDGGITEHLLILDEDGEAESEFHHATPTLAALVAIAIHDVDRTVERDGEAGLDADMWKGLRAGADGPICTRCLAGATLARMGVPEEEPITFILDRRQAAGYDRGQTPGWGGGGDPREAAVMEAGEPPAESAAAKLYALDDIRQGKIARAAERFYGYRDVKALEGAKAVAREEHTAVRRVEEAKELRDWTSDRKAYAEVARLLEAAGV